MDATATTCVHCNANLTADDMNSGWCDSCGKRLPSGPKPVFKKAGDAAPAPIVSGGTNWPWVFGVMAVALLFVGAASVVAFAR